MGSGRDIRHLELAALAPLLLQKSRRLGRWAASQRCLRSLPRVINFLDGEERPPTDVDAPARTLIAAAAKSADLPLIAELDGGPRASRSGRAPRA